MAPVILPNVRAYLKSVCWRLPNPPKCRYFVRRNQTDPMRRTFRIILFFLLAIKTAGGQTFQPLPSGLLQQEVLPEQANECFIFFENLGGDSLQLRWKQLEAHFPPAWIVDLCDFGHCYAGIPANGLMNKAGLADQPYLKLIVQPGAIPGDAWFWFRVWVDGEPANFADVFFSLQTPGVTAATEPPASTLHFFPNPVSDLLFLENRNNMPVPARIFDASGIPKWEGSLPPLQQTELAVGDWPPGWYIIQTPTETRVFLHLK